MNTTEIEQMLSAETAHKISQENKTDTNNIDRILARIKFLSKSGIFHDANFISDKNIKILETLGYTVNIRSDIDTDTNLRFVNVSW